MSLLLTSHATYSLLAGADEDDSDFVASKLGQVTAGRTRLDTRHY